MPTLLAYRWYFVGLATHPSTQAAVLVLLEPATAAFLATRRGEQISSAFVLGSILLPAAVAVLACDQARTRSLRLRPAGEVNRPGASTGLENRSPGGRAP
ncbi:DMT family transporter [Streptomyces sp. IBSBF 2807]|nr:DMT family transporter [Streptomyces hilarionis]